MKKPLLFLSIPILITSCASNTPPAETELAPVEYKVIDNRPVSEKGPSSGRQGHSASMPSLEDGRVLEPQSGERGLDHPDLPEGAASERPGEDYEAWKARRDAEEGAGRAPPDGGADMNGVMTDYDFEQTPQYTKADFTNDAPQSLPPSLFDPFQRPDEITIEHGDTLFNISQRYTVSLDALKQLNGLSEPFTIRIGEKLYIPKAKIHEVEKGETLMALSRRYNVHYHSLASFNGLTEPYTLHPGDRIALPTLVTDNGKAPSGQSLIAQKEANPIPAEHSNIVESEFIWPVSGDIVSNFGPGKKGIRNDGVNIAAKAGAPVKATGSGNVVYAGQDLAGLGNLVLVKHPNGWTSAYAHASKLLVDEGAQVKQGQPIALAGATGAVEHPQLHFELRKGTRPVNPVKVLPKIAMALLISPENSLPKPV